MPHRDPTIRSRELGDGVRRAMTRAGLTGQQVAQLLGCSESLVSLLLAGKRGIREVDLAAFLGVCRFKGPERERLLALCRER
ncbi:MAG: helix-turn-helix domain-containing protein, partial [Pseudonocardiaceae bacterium]